MKNYIRLWASHLENRKPWDTVPFIIKVTGERPMPLGRFEYAKVDMILEPAADFEVVNEVNVTEDLKRIGYPDYCIFGLLDILMTNQWPPLRSVKVTLRHIDYHPVEAVPLTLLKAGRDAGRKVSAAIAAIQKNK